MTRYSESNSICVAVVLASFVVARVLVFIVSATILGFIQCRQGSLQSQTIAFDHLSLKNDDEGTVYYGF